MPRSKSSRRWLKEHFSDPYVKKAQHQGYRSRAIFKLIQLDEQKKLFKAGMTVVDLGAAPGGWSQWLSQRVGKMGQVFALDILPMDPLPGVNFIQGDFNDPEVVQHLLKMLNEKQADFVISDIAPNKTGIAMADQARSMYLAELALAFTQQVLRKEGGFLVKVFQGSGFEEYLKNMRSVFKKVIIRKPDASRSRSNEVYLLGSCLKQPE